MPQEVNPYQNKPDIVICLSKNKSGSYGLTSRLTEVFMLGQGGAYRKVGLIQKMKLKASVKKEDVELLLIFPELAGGEHFKKVVRSNIKIAVDNGAIAKTSAKIGMKKK